MGKSCALEVEDQEMYRLYEGLRLAGVAVDVADYDIAVLEDDIAVLEDDNYYHWGIGQAEVGNKMRVGLPRGNMG